MESILTKIYVSVVICAWSFVQGAFLSGQIRGASGDVFRRSPPVWIDA